MISLDVIFYCMNRSIDGKLKQNNLTLQDHFVQCGMYKRSFHHRTETPAVWLSNGYFGLSKAAKKKKVYTTHNIVLSCLNSPAPFRDNTQGDPAIDLVDNTD